MIELKTEEPQKNKTHTWRLYWFHASDLDASYPADGETLAKAGYVPQSALATARSEHESIVQGLRGELERLTECNAAVVADMRQEQEAASELLREVDGLRGELERKKAATRAYESITDGLRDWAHRMNIGAVTHELHRLMAAEQKAWSDEQSATAAESARPDAAKCHYCNRTHCGAQQDRDDPKQLRICRHATRLERDFLAKRVGRLESALKESAKVAKDEEDLRAENRQHCLDFQATAKALGILEEWPEQPRVIERIAELRAQLRDLTAENGELRALADGRLADAQKAVDQNAVLKKQVYDLRTSARAYLNGADGSFHHLQWALADAERNVRNVAVVGPSPTREHDPRLADALANPPGPRHAKLKDPGPSPGVPVAAADSGAAKPRETADTVFAASDNPGDGAGDHVCRTDDGVTCVTCQRDMSPGGAIGEAKDLSPSGQKAGNDEPRHRSTSEIRDGRGREGSGLHDAAERRAIQQAAADEPPRATEAGGAVAGEAEEEVATSATGEAKPEEHTCRPDDLSAYCASCDAEYEAEMVTFAAKHSLTGSLTRAPQGEQKAAFAVGQVVRWKCGAWTAHAVDLVCRIKSLTAITAQVAPVDLQGERWEYTAALANLTVVEPAEPAPPAELSKRDTWTCEVCGTVMPLDRSCPNCPAPPAEVPLTRSELAALLRRAANASDMSAPSDWLGAMAGELEKRKEG